MTSQAPAFLVEHFDRLRGAEWNTSTGPLITLTWAQSLDAKIAGPGGARVMISGPESMAMTHWMRTMHDSILIGINTLIMDDPRLKIQLVPQDDPTLFPPQPLILDPKLRFPLSSRILSEWVEWNKRLHVQSKDRPEAPGIVRQPWIICGLGVSYERVKAVENAGARVVRTALAKDGRIPPVAMPELLNSLGLSSVMIEGGSNILSSFLHSPPRSDGTPLVDSVIVTVAPMFIGEGVSIVPEGHDKGLPLLRTLHTETMGKDSVMVCSIV